MKSPISPSDINALRHLREESKFGPASNRLYPGAPDEQTRVRCAAVIDEMLDSLISASPNIQESFVLKRFSLAMRRLKQEDSEEIEEAGAYCEAVMSILEIESSRGILNRGRYGFLLGTLLSIWPRGSKT